MASTVRRCCDPFKKHHNVITSPLREVSPTLIRKWSPLISPGNFVCVSCRKNLVALQPCYVSISDRVNLNTARARIEGGSKMNLSPGTKMSKSSICAFCGVGKEKGLDLGEMHSIAHISAHYYCLLFSSGLPQNGEDEEGIFGFMPPDIEKELARGKKLQCAFCARKGATIGCSEKKCRRSYHYRCGISHHALFKFTGDFRSYCQQHREYQIGLGLGKNFECLICMDDVVADPKTAVWAPCCRKESWFHKTCIQKLALSAGYFFKCPLCNDKETFVEEMQNVGIYVPEKDASWELEPNAYSELERPVRCDAEKCLCPEGRKLDDIGTRWEILLCNLCGASGMHISCGKLRFTCTEWTCSVCRGMLKDSVKRMKQEVRERRLLGRREKEEMRIQSSRVQNSNTTVAPSVTSSTAVHDISLTNTSILSGVSSGESSDIGVTDQTSEGSNLAQRENLGVSESNCGSSTSLNSVDCNETLTKLTYASDSDEEIDVELGEYQVPPHTIIRELEESGEELNKKLRKLWDFAVRAQERMQELRLTEMEIVKMAKEFSSSKLFTLDKSMVIKFFRCNLPLDKMLQMVTVIKAIYSLREAIILSSTKKQDNSPSIVGKRRKRRLKATGAVNIQVTFSKSALSKTIAKVGDVCNGDQSNSRILGDLEELEESLGVSPLADTSYRESNEACEADLSQNRLSEEKPSPEDEPSSETGKKEPNVSSVDSPNQEWKLNLSLSPHQENTPLYLRHLRTSKPLDMTPPLLKNSSKKNKENSVDKLYSLKKERDFSSPVVSKQPLEESTTADHNILNSQITPLVIGQDSTLKDETGSNVIKASSFTSTPVSEKRVTKASNCTSTPLSETKVRKKRGRKPKRRLSLCFDDTKGSELLNKVDDDKAKTADRKRPRSSLDESLSDNPPKKKRARSHDCNKYIQKTLTSYFIPSNPVKSS